MAIISDVREAKKKNNTQEVVERSGQLTRAYLPTFLDCCRHAGSRSQNAGRVLVLNGGLRVRGGSAHAQPSR